MNVEKAVRLIESSFLSELLKDENITDVSYNGVDIYYQHNDYGRMRYEMNVSNEEVYDFVRQLSNLSEKFFSISEPILDISVGKYRINAVHPSIARVGNDKALTLSIRISSSKIKILNDNKFMPISLDKLLKIIVANHQSIVISGLTGTGKTELQKYLLMNMAKNTRIIVIDNVLELDQIRLNKELDINSWQFDDRNKAIPVSLLIKNALRSNPDWLIIAESRGQEMIEVLNSALTGIPIITTLHSESVDTIVPRMVSMVKMNDKKMEDDDIKSDIYSHIHFYIYVRKKVEKDGKISRFISDLIFINNEGQKFVIFDRQKDDKNIYLDSQLCDLLNIDRKVLK